jgi:hypothetical protein
LILVDEFQDCRDGRLGMVQALARDGDVLVAADEFQELGYDDSSPAVTWARAAGEVTPLEEVHRTRKVGLLDAATAIRGGRPPSKGTGFIVLSARQANPGAKFVAQRIAWSAGGDVAILSPTGPVKSAFVRNVLARLAQGPFTDKNDVTMGPHSVSWELSRDELARQLHDRLALPSDADARVTVPEFMAGASLPAMREVERWFQHRRRVLDATTFTVTEIRSVIERCVNHVRAYARHRGRLQAMTIHQAKNREFEHVVLLWPFEVTGGEEARRRLLYNAVTRARASATVIVQDPTGTRTQERPFGSAEAAPQERPRKAQQKKRQHSG